MRKLFLSVAVLLSSVAYGQSVQEWRDSLQALGKAIDNNPQSVELRLRKAAVNLELSQWDYAIEEYGRVLNLDSCNLSALYFRGYANMQSRRYAMAVVDYERILSIVPKHFEAQLGLAMATKKTAGVVAAMDQFNRLVQLFPDSALAYAARAGFEVEQGKLETALFDWDEAIRLSSGNADFVISKVDVLLQLNRKREAKALLQELVAKGTPRAALKEWLDRCK